MDVVLFRHAKKGMLPFEDPGLTPEGLMQSERLPDIVNKYNLPAAAALWASEKIRTHQTFQGLASTFKLNTETKAELNLRSESESQNMFQQRVKILIDELTLSACNDLQSCIYLCTHYDWIEEAMAIIPSDKNLLTFEFNSWAPAQFVHFKITKSPASTIWKFMKKGVCP